MFSLLSDKLDDAFRKMRGLSKITESNIKDALRDVRMALLDADVEYSVAREFIAHVKEEAMGEKVLKSVKPGEQLVKIFRDQLAELLGGDGQAVQSTMVGLVAGTGDGQNVALNIQDHVGMHVLGQGAHGALDGDDVALGNLNSNACGDGNRLLTNSRHSVTSLPDEGQNFAADVQLTGLLVGHNTLGSGDDGDTQALQNLGLCQKFFSASEMI